MSSYNFDEIIPRIGSESVKWDTKPDMLPFWIADMDFKTAPCVLKAVHEKVEQGILGYTFPLDRYYSAIQWWLMHRHSWKVEKEWITPIGGLIPAATVALRAFAKPGDEVIMQTPTYNCFFGNLKHTGCKISDNKLIYKDGEWSIDFDDFEKKARTAKVFLLCNPQNPVGRLWTKEELERMGDICLKYGVVVVADEIHIDLLPPGSKATPFATIKKEFSEKCISFNSPTKCFNIAGLQVSNIICRNEEYRNRIWNVIDEMEHRDLNQVGVAALEGAFTPEGEEWLNQLNAYLHENYMHFKDVIGKELPFIGVSKLEATYLSWLDCRALPISTEELQKSLEENESLRINAGDMYGGPGFIRFNLACPRATLDEGLGRFIKGVRRIMK